MVRNAPAASRVGGLTRTLQWSYFLRNCNAGVKPTEAFYCGDAAGRPADKALKLKKDHSACACSPAAGPGPLGL